MTRFTTVAAALDGIPNMSRSQGRRVYNHLRDTGARDVLEIGTASGVSACFMAAALPVGGRVTTIDHVAATRSRFPQPADIVAFVSLQNRIERILVEDSSYTWWLKNKVLRQSDGAGNCEALYDFCYLDGAHNFTIDGLTVILVERLLRPGAWLLLDDLRWTYKGGSHGGGQTPHDLRLSRAERSEPHMQAVFDLIVRPHPSFTEFRIENGNWGWARKSPAGP